MDHMRIIRAAENHMHTGSVGKDGRDEHYGAIGHPGMSGYLVSNGESESNGQSGPRSHFTLGMLKNTKLMDEMTQYLPKPIHKWQIEDCQSWMTDVCRRLKINANTIKVSSLNLTGVHLLQWNFKDYCLLFGVNYGPIIFNELRRKDKELGTNSSCIQRIDNTTSNKLRAERGPKVWEFLAATLASSTYNPSLLAWQSEQEGTFLLVNVQMVIKLWGININISNSKPNTSLASILDDNVEDTKIQANTYEYQVYQHFLRNLRLDMTDGSLAKVDESHIRYKLGPAAMEFYRQLKKT